MQRNYEKACIIIDHDKNKFYVSGISTPALPNTFAFIDFDIIRRGGRL